MITATHRMQDSVGTMTYYRATVVGKFVKRVKLEFYCPYQEKWVKSFFPENVIHMEKL